MKPGEKVIHLAEIGHKMLDGKLTWDIERREVIFLARHRAAAWVKSKGGWPYTVPLKSVLPLLKEIE